MRVRLAGIVPMGSGFAFMHRVGVQNHPIGEYYVFKNHSYFKSTKKTGGYSKYGSMCN
mgnify:CR=1 FL=1